MVASDTRSRKLSILIGSDSQDWSNHWSLLSVNYSSLKDQGGRGMIIVEAELTFLKTTSPPESLSPRSNPSRWRPGQPIYIQCRNDADTAYIDTWFSRLIILEEPAEPTVEDDSLSLRLGCKLAWASLFQLDDDGSGVAFGVAENCSAVGSRLLQASEISAGDISLSSWPYTIDYPFGKNTNSFADQAGELAWANDGRILYQNTAGTITEKALSFTPNSAIATITIGTNDVLWRPLSDPQQPPETTKAAGVGRSLSTLPNPETIAVSTTGDFSDYVPNATGSGEIRLTTTTTSFSPGDVNTNPVTPPTKTRRVQVEELPAMIFQDASDVSPSLAVTEFTDITEVKTYESGLVAPIGKAKLLSVTTTKKQRGKSLINSDGLGNMRDVDITTISRTHDANNEFVSQLQSVNQQAEILLDESTTNPWNLQDIKSETVTWEQTVPGLFSQETVTAEALISKRSNVDKSKQNIWAAQVTTEPIGPSLDNKPPAVEFYDGGTNAAEIHYEGTASYIHRGGATGRNRERLYTLDFGFSNAQMATMAALHRDLLIGRHLGDEMELAINDTLLQTPPLPEMHVVNGSDTFKYLGDALAMEFAIAEATAHCAGIWLEGGYQETFVGGFTMPAQVHSGSLASPESLSGGFTMPDQVHSGELASPQSLSGGFTMPAQVHSGALLDIDANNFINRLGGAYSQTQLNTIHDFFVALKVDNSYSKLAAAWILKLQSSTDALLNIKGTSYTASATGMTFTAGGGFTGNGTTGRIDTTFIPSSEALVGQDNISMGYYSNTAGPQSSTDMGAHAVSDAGSDRLFIASSFPVSPDTMFAAVNSAQDTVGNSFGDGLFIANRIASGQFTVSRNNATLLTSSNASNGQIDRPIYVAARNDGTVLQSSTRQYAFAFVGQGLTTAEQTTINNAVSTLLANL